MFHVYIQIWPFIKFELATPAQFTDKNSSTIFYSGLPGPEKRPNRNPALTQFEKAKNNIFANFYVTDKQRSRSSCIPDLIKALDKHKPCFCKLPQIPSISKYSHSLALSHTHYISLSLILSHLHTHKLSLSLSLYIGQLNGLPN